MEKEALNKWGDGDPSGFLNISDPDVVYFDPMTPKRIDGLTALTELYEKLKGKIHVDYYKMLNPKVQLGKDMAVLTYNLISHSSKGKSIAWNCTEVYKLNSNNKLRIIQTHWSLTGHKLN